MPEGNDYTMVTANYERAIGNQIQTETKLDDKVLPYLHISRIAMKGLCSRFPVTTEYRSKGKHSNLFVAQRFGMRIMEVSPS